MPKITFIGTDGEARTIGANAGDSVMETAVRGGITGITGECGGSLSCATCHVIVDEPEYAALPAMDELEDEMLWGTAVPRTGTSRLSCQIRLTEDMDLRVRLPERQV